MSRKVELEKVHIVPDVKSGSVALVSMIETDDGPKVDKAVDRSREFYIAVVNAVPPGYTRVLKLQKAEGDKTVDKYYRIEVSEHDEIAEKEGKIEVVR